MSTHAFEKSIAWQKGYALALDIYRITVQLPLDERYGLTAQIRRSASSVVFNIAEGLLRGTRKELSQFFIVARGSCGELETQLMLAQDLCYISKETSAKLIDKTTEIIRILSASIKTLQSAS